MALLISGKEEQFRKFNPNHGNKMAHFYFAVVCNDGASEYCPFLLTHFAHAK